MTPGTFPDPAENYGRPGPTLGSKRVNWAFRTASSGTEELWTGTILECRGKLATMIANSATTDPIEAMTLDEKAGMAQLMIRRAAAATDAQYIPEAPPVYTMMSQKLSSPIESHRYFAPLIDGTSKIQDVWNAFEMGQGYDASWTDEQKRLFDFYCIGTHEYFQFTYTFTETRTVNRTSLQLMDHSNVGRCDSAIAVAKIAQAITVLGTVPACDWLKNPPEVRTHGAHLYDLVTQWDGIPTANGGGWSKILHGGSAVP